MGLVKALSSSFSVVLVDFNGFGMSPEPPRPYSIDDYVRTVLEVVRFYKMESVSLVCHSFGGRVGIKFCYKYGYLVDKLVLVDSAGMKPRRLPKYYLSVFRHKLLNFLKIKHVAGSPDYRKLSPVMKKTFVLVVNEHLERFAEYVKVPTLLIWGNKDKETPVYMGKRLLRLIAGSEMILFLGCGHFSYAERYPIFNSAVKQFLSGEWNELDNGSGKRGVLRRKIYKIPDPRAKQ